MITNIKGITEKLLRGLLLVGVVGALLLPALPLDAQNRSKKKATTHQTAKAKPKAGSRSKSGSKSKTTNRSKTAAKKNDAGKSGKKKGVESSKDIKKQHEATRREISLTKEQIKENDAAVRKNLTELGRLGGDIDESKKKVADTDAKVKALNREIGTLQGQIESEEKSLAKLRAEYLKAVKKMRSKRKQQSKLAFVFGAGSFNEAVRRMRYLKQFSEWREKQSSDISRKVAGLKVKTEKLAQTKSMHDRELAVQVKAQKQLETQYARQDAVVVELKKNGQALHSHLERKQQEANALNNRIAALIAEEQRKAEAQRRAEERRAEERRIAEQRRAEAQREAELEAERREREAAANQQLAQNEPPKSKSPKKETPKKEKSKKDTSKKDVAEKEQVKKQKTKKGGDVKVTTGSESEVSYAEARRRKPRRATAPESSASSAPSAGKSKTAAKAAASGGNFEGMMGSLPRPVSGAFKVTSRFGRQSLPDMPNVSYDNPGIDAEVTAGASAQAVFAGKVSGVYMLPGYNTVVIVNHGKYYTVYGNIAAAGVKVGDDVKQGQSLGRLAPQDDDPSHSTIHFEVWRNRDKLDPLRWIR